MIIHASNSRFYRDELEGMLEIAHREGFTKRDLRGFAPDNYVVDLMPQGAIVGVARLAEVFGPEDTITDDHPAFESPWAEDEASYWLYFSELRTVEPVPFKGRVGLFKVPYDVAVNLQPFRLESRVEGNDGIRGAIQHP
jgi:hypothetical protein